jgi:putative hemolysin
LDKWLDTDGNHDLIKPDYSNFVCYKMDKLKSIFVLSTDGFSQNSYSKYKLHYVKDQTQQLEYKYSLLVNQYSLSENAYNYWENLRKNNQETVDLFGKQPANVKGNIHNINDTTDVALGYFGVSSVQSKRIMVLPIEGLLFDKAQPCKAYKIENPLPPDRPMYFVNDYDENWIPYTGIGAPECIFCTMAGGTTVKPPYWDEK